MASEEFLLKQFKEQLITFMDELIEKFPNESEFIILRILIKDQMKIENIMGKFLKEIYPKKNDIKNRKDSFFIENNFLSTTNGSLFKNLWRSEILDREDKDIIWKWMDAFLYIGSTYLSNYGYIKNWEPST